MTEDHTAVVSDFQNAGNVSSACASSREALRAWLAARLCADLAEPIVVDRRNRNRFTILRGIEVVINRRCRTIMVRGRNGRHAHAWLYGNLKLDRVLSGPHSAQAWWWAVRQELPDVLRKFGDDAVDDGLSEWISREMRRSGLVRAARRRIITVLRLNPRLLARARALSHDGIATTGHYVSVWCCARESKLRMREVAALWPLYDVVDHFPRADPRAIKLCLRRAGITQGGWRLLCRHGRALWWPMRRCHQFKLTPKVLIVRYANLLAASGRRGLPPSSLTLAFGKVASMLDDERGGARWLRPIFMAAWQRLETLDGDVAKTAFVAGSLDCTLAFWLAQPALPRVPAGARWGWFERFAATGMLRQQTAPISRWPSFGRWICIDGIDIRPLRGTQDVQAAGLVLRNCMATPDGRTRHTPLFLMRDRMGRAIAMFSAVRCDGVGELCEIRARFNRPVNVRLREVALAYLKMPGAGIRFPRTASSPRGSWRCGVCGTPR